MGADVRFVYSRYRHASGRRVVHMAEAGADRTPCGVLAGDEARGMPIDCGTCRDAAGQSGRDAGPLRVLIATGPEEARIKPAAYDPAIVSVIRAAAPGAWWNRDDKYWSVASLDAADVAASLAAAGFAVTMAGDPPAPAGPPDPGGGIPDGLAFSRRRTLAGTRDAAGRFTVTDARGERTGPPGQWHAHCWTAGRLAAAGAPHAGETACGLLLPSPAETAAEPPTAPELCPRCLRSMRAGWRGMPVSWPAVYAANAAAAGRYPANLPPERRAALCLARELTSHLSRRGLTAASAASCLASGAELGRLWLAMSDATRAALTRDARLGDVGDLAAWLGRLDPGMRLELAALAVTFELAEAAGDRVLCVGIAERSADLLTQPLREQLVGPEAARQAAAADLAAEREELARAQDHLAQDTRLPEAIMRAMAWSIQGSTTAGQVALRLEDPDLLAGIYLHLARLAPGPLAAQGIISAWDLARWTARLRRHRDQNGATLDQALADWALDPRLGAPPGESPALAARPETRSWRREAGFCSRASCSGGGISRENDGSGTG